MSSDECFRGSEESIMSEREETDPPRAREGRRRATTASHLLERGRQVERDAQSFMADVEGLISDVESLVRANLEARPYATLSAAAGAGFVVGGGLTVGVLGTVARMGVRIATAALMQSVLSRATSGVRPDHPRKP
jgi:hypothetical protein